MKDFIKIICLFWGLRIYSGYLFPILDAHTHSHTHTHTHTHTCTHTHTNTHTHTHTHTHVYIYIYSALIHDAFIFKHKLTTSWISTGSNALNLTGID